MADMTAGIFSVVGVTDIVVLQRFVCEL